MVFGGTSEENKKLIRENTGLELSFCWSLADGVADSKAKLATPMLSIFTNLLPDSFMAQHFQDIKFLELELI